MWLKATSKIAKDFHHAIQSALETGNLNLDKLHLAQDAVLLLPGERYEGKAAIVDALSRKFIPAFKKCNMIREYADNATSCTIYEFLSKKTSHPVAAAEWLRISDGFIFEIQLFYDTAEWAKVA